MNGNDGTVDGGRIQRQQAVNQQVEVRVAYSAPVVALSGFEQQIEVERPTQDGLIRELCGVV